jgi:hypothetical protein
MSSECRACATGLQHCHGTVIHHAQHRSECTHDDCETPEVAHGFAVDCAAVGCSCGQAVVSAAAGNGR